MSPQLSIALLAGVAAAVEDIARRRVSNWIPVTAAVSGLVCLTLQHGWRGTLSSLAGLVAGFFVFFIFYLLGGMGGGDIKLMAGLGAVLGIENLVQAALWTAGLGGVFAAIYLCVVEVRNWWVKRKGGAAGPLSIPYAPAIAVGSWLALLPKS